MYHIKVLGSFIQWAFYNCREHTNIWSLKFYSAHKNWQGVKWNNITYLTPRSSLFKLLRTSLFSTVFSKVFMSESSIIFSSLYQYTEGSGSPGKIDHFELYDFYFFIIRPILMILHFWGKESLCSFVNFIKKDSKDFNDYLNHISMKRNLNSLE